MSQGVPLGVGVAVGVGAGVGDEGGEALDGSSVGVGAVLPEGVVEGGSDVGAVSAGALAVIVALVSNGFMNAVFVLILIIAVQQLEGNVLSPVLQSQAMGLHAAVVLLAVAVGGTLFGIVGAFLAVPVAALLAVGYRYARDQLDGRHPERDDDGRVPELVGDASKAARLLGWRAQVGLAELVGRMVDGDRG